LKKVPLKVFMSKPVIIKSSDPIDEAVEAFRRGGVIAYPTETFYALGADPFNAEAVKKVFALKGRPAKNPVSVIVKDREMLARVAASVPEAAYRLMERFWPGPLTIIFDALPSVPALLTAGTGSIGARVSSSPLSQKLTSVLDSPITATSANPSGKAPALTAERVIEYFDGLIDVIIDGGTLKGRLGSTIVDVTGDGIKILREGEIPSEEIKA